MAEIIMVKTADLIPYAKNARKNEGAVEAVVNSIREFGFLNPIIVDKDMVIICGHTRRLAALEMGLDEVPCIIAEDLTPDQVNAFRLADNRVAELSSWDEDLLTQEILSILSIDLSNFGFKQSMLQDAFEETEPVKKHVCPRCGAEWRE